MHNKNSNIQCAIQVLPYCTNPLNTSNKWKNVVDEAELKLSFFKRTKTDNSAMRLSHNFCSVFFLLKTSMFVLVFYIPSSERNYCANEKSKVVTQLLLRDGECDNTLSCILFHFRHNSPTPQEKVLEWYISKGTLHWFSFMFLNYDMSCARVMHFSWNNDYIQWPYHDLPWLETSRKTHNTGCFCGWHGIGVCFLYFLSCGPPSITFMICHSQ